MKKSKSILMHFDNKHDLLHGIDALQHYKIPICEVYTPRRIDGLEKKLSIKNIKLGYTILKFGCLGGIAFTTLVYYLFEQHDLTKFTTKSLFELLFNISIILITLLLATRLFPGAAPKILNRKSNDRRYLIVVEAKNVAPNEELMNLFEYAGAVELSPSIKNMITS